MIGQRIKALRQGLGLTQGALALRMGLTQQAIAKWEAGKSSPDYHMLVRLAQALDVGADMLFSTSEMVPVIGEVKAGFGLPAYEEEQGLEPAMVKDPSQYFYLTVQGDSMEPRIHDKDLALIRKQPTLEDGDLGVVVYGDGEGTIKRFYHKGDTVALQAFNPAYETLILSGDELDKLIIIGKVVETKTRW
ncbi:MAG: XRE family transcriptional regulator [Clostridiales bacterium]|nr:XRE family transcriptional regulator [Clostridiales bacterium]